LNIVEYLDLELKKNYRKNFKWKLFMCSSFRAK